jgi:hypothetical protein
LFWEKTAKLNNEKIKRSETLLFIYITLKI